MILDLYTRTVTVSDLCCILLLVSLTSIYVYSRLSRAERAKKFSAHGHSFSDFLSALLPTLSLGRGFSELSKRTFTDPFRALSRIKIRICTCTWLYTGLEDGSKES